MSSDTSCDEDSLKLLQKEAEDVVQNYYLIWMIVGTIPLHVCTFAGHYGPAVALIGLSYAPAGNVAVAAALLTFVVGLNAGTYTGYMLVHIDMAPNFAGTMMGITNCISKGLSIAAPLVAGAILKDQTSAAEWRNVFYLSSVIYIIGNTIFLIFGTSERQQWNEVDDSTTGDDEEKSEKTNM